MEKHRCKLCARRFGSGRALGGHMRSHFTILPLPTKTQLLSETPSSSSDEKLHFVEDSEESEIELKSLHPLGSRRYRKRSGTELEKLVKKKKKSLTEQLVSSEPETCSEEDLAMWLMLLSRDKWVIKEEQHRPVQKSSDMQNGTGDHVRIHECPVCYKVFKSGQALGGHKRSHLLTSTAASVASSSSAAHSSAGNLWLIDLNLPAPLEEDGQEISHTQIPVLC
ncbi:unnamed protein product [Rhodiola kirilowii]